MSKVNDCANTHYLLSGDTPRPNDKVYPLVDAIVTIHMIATGTCPPPESKVAQARFRALVVWVRGRVEEYWAPTKYVTAVFDEAVRAMGRAAVAEAELFLQQRGGETQLQRANKVVAWLLAHPGNEAAQEQLRLVLAEAQNPKPEGASDGSISEFQWQAFKAVFEDALRFGMSLKTLKLISEGEQ